VSQSNCFSALIWNWNVESARTQSFFSLSLLSFHVLYFSFPNHQNPSLLYQTIVFCVQYHALYYSTVQYSTFPSPHPDASLFPSLSLSFLLDGHSSIFNTSVIYSEQLQYRTGTSTLLYLPLAFGGILKSVSFSSVSFFSCTPLALATARVITIAIAILLLLLLLLQGTSIMNYCWCLSSLVLVVNKFSLVVRVCWSEWLRCMAHVWDCVGFLANSPHIQLSLVRPS